VQARRRRRAQRSLGFSARRRPEGRRGCLFILRWPLRTVIWAVLPNHGPLACCGGLLMGLLPAQTICLLGEVGLWACGSLIDEFFIFYSNMYWPRGLAVGPRPRAPRR
jgi:hypothetical protein